jgi:hypothetical protein
MDKVGVFIDCNDQFFRVGKKYGDKRKLNYSKYLEKCAEYGEVVRAIAYGSQIEHSADKFCNSLSHIGFDINYLEVEPGKWHDWGVGISVDVIRIATLLSLDHVILGVSSRSLVPLYPYLKDRGIKIHTLAVGIAKELKRASTSWEDLGEEYLEETQG